MSSFWNISVFWIFVLLSIAVALAAVLVPLFRRDAKAGGVNRDSATVAIYRDQLAELQADRERGEIGAQEYEDARLEIEKRLAEEVPGGKQAAPAPQNHTGRRAGFVLAGVIPVATIGLYALFGTPAALNAASADHAMQGQQHDIAAMVTSLEAKMQQNPNDPNGWVMLGRSYEMMERFPEAAEAFAKAVALVPNEASVLSDYAEALALAQNRTLAGKPLELVNKALKMNPADEKALELAAIAAQQAGDFKKEASYWRRLEQAMAPNSPYLKEVAMAAEQAEQAAGLPKSKKAVTPKAGAALSGTLRLSKELSAKVAPEDTIFLIAKGAGAKMPLAILRLEARQLPYEFTMDDSNAMMDGSKLSDYAEVTVSARVAKGGDAMARSGDLQGVVNGVKVGRKDVNITIDTVMP